MSARHRPRRRTLLGLLAVLVLAAGAFAFALVGLSPDGGDHDGTALATKARRAPVAHSTALVVKVPARSASVWTVAATVGGVPAVWAAHQHGVALLRVDQQLVGLHLHAGWNDGGKHRWQFGDKISAAEMSKIVAAVNGGFKFPYKNTGFMAQGRTAVPLKPGLASIVTYTDGTTNIGGWLQGVPSSQKQVFSVLQNQFLLVDHGAPARNLNSCVISCWGGTIRLATVVPRSGMGITASGQLVWAGGEHLSPAGLAHALIAAGAQRAIELDINPYWVAGYLYTHRAHHLPHAVGLVTGQLGIQGALMKAYSRDFFTFVVR